MSTSSLISSYVEAKQALQELPLEFDSLKRECTIFFGDLVGSTAFKQAHPPIAGIRRVQFHNTVLTKHIRANGGRVIKSLGDGVLAVFEGEHGSVNAIRAGLNAIANLKSFSEKDGDLQNVETKIGIHKGNRVWFFKDEGSTVDDPLGLDVDIAARLVSLADPQRIVCTSETYIAATAAGLEKDTHSVGNICQRFVKGVESCLEVRALCPKNSPDDIAGDVPWHGHERVVPKRLRACLEEARTAFRSERWFDSLRGFVNVLHGYRDAENNVIEGDPANYEANSGLGELIVGGHVTQNDLHKCEINEPMYLYAFHRFCVAKQTYPHLARVWLGLAWIRFQWWASKAEITLKGKRQTPDDHAQKACENAAKALTDAIARRDPEAIALANAYLAKYTWQTDRSKMAKSLEFAQQAELALTTNLDKHRSMVCVVLAELLIERASENTTATSGIFEDARRIIKRAGKFDPDNPEVDLAEAKLKTLLRTRGSQSPVVSKKRMSRQHKA